ncbi:hypothetical protein [Streptomyces sp. NPDC055036]
MIVVPPPRLRRVLLLALLDTRIERRLLLAIPQTPFPPGSARRIASGCPRRARWWTPDQLRECAAPVQPAELPDIVDGYWDGWLPDGPLTLDWN